MLIDNSRVIFHVSELGGFFIWLIIADKFSSGIKWSLHSKRAKMCVQQICISSAKRDYLEKISKNI